MPVKSNSERAKQIAKTLGEPTTGTHSTNFWLEKIAERIQSGSGGAIDSVNGLTGAVTIEGTSVGDGQPVYKQTTNNTETSAAVLQFKTLLSSDYSVDVTATANEIDIKLPEGAGGGIPTSTDIHAIHYRPSQQEWFYVGQENIPRWNTKVYDYTDDNGAGASAWDTSAKTYTVRESGIYYVEGGIDADNSAGFWKCFVNGVQVLWPGVKNQSTGSRFSFTVRLAADDVLRMALVNWDVAGWTGSGNQYTNYIKIHMVSKLG